MIYENYKFILYRISFKIKVHVLSDKGDNEGLVNADADENNLQGFDNPISRL